VPEPGPTAPPARPLASRPAAYPDGVPAPLGPLRRAVRETGLALITLGVIVLLFVAYQLLGTNITEAHNQDSLARQFQAALGPRAPAPSAAPTSPATPAATTPDVLPSVPPGGAIEELRIPAIGVTKYVVEGTNEDDLRRGPGHYSGTAYPGQVGNTAIAGHRTTYGAPFFELNELAVGDPIYITDLNDRTYTYLVDEAPQVVSPDDVAVLDPTAFAQLTLTTCNPRFSATSRLVVFARLKGQAAKVTAPVDKPVVVSGRARTSTPGTVLAGADNLGTGESGAWPPSIAYGALALAMWAAVRLWINRTRRWHRLAAYVVGIGVCLIPLWFCFENAILLLPQSI
jgi:sortase A